MAKKSTMLFRLLSSAGTGYFYVGKKNVRYCYNYEETHWRNLVLLNMIHLLISMLFLMRWKCHLVRKEHDLNIWPEIIKIINNIINKVQTHRSNSINYKRHKIQHSINSSINFWNFRMVLFAIKMPFAILTPITFQTF